MYLQHTMLHIRVNITCIQNLNTFQYKLLFCVKNNYMTLFISFYILSSTKELWTIFLIKRKKKISIRLWYHNSKSFQYILILWLQPWLVKFFNHNKKSILSCLKLFAKTNLVSIKAQVVVMSFSVKLLSVVMLFPVIPAKCFLHLQSPRVNINTVYWHSLQLQNIKKDNICLY